VCRSGVSAVSLTGVNFIGHGVIAVAVSVMSIARGSTPAMCSRVTANSWWHVKTFLSVASHCSIAIAGVSWLYRPRLFISCVVAGWLYAGRGVTSAFSNAAQQLSELDRGAGGFFW